MASISLERKTSAEVFAIKDCIDVDGHEFYPMHMWEEVFGEGGAAAVSCCDNGIMANAAENNMLRDDVQTDELEINDFNVWSLKGVDAPSSIDISRRPAVLDFMGVKRQLMYPSYANVGLMMYTNEYAHTFFNYDPSKVDRIKLSKQIIASYNVWAMKVAREHGDTRMRPVAIMLTENLETMMAEGAELIAAGIRAIMLPSGLPPLNSSPGDAQLDPFWKMFADANVAVTLHIGSEFPLLKSPLWDANVPQFVSSVNSSAEFPLQPYWGSTLHLAAENYLTAMVLGGVFERVPNLRFASIEAGAQWLGPLAERLDMWAAEFHKRMAGYLTMKPSEYINRNVRVSAFDFEDVALYFTRYTSLSNCYCFATDYPHREGGRFSKQTFYDKLAPLNDQTVLDKFFRENGEWLLPQ